MRRTAAAVAVAAVLLAACGGGGGDGGAPDPGGAGGGATGVKLQDVRVRLAPVAALQQPLALAVRPGDERFYVAEKTGRVQAVAGGRTTAVLDLSGEVSGALEQGLLGLTFSPDGTHLYVDLTDRSGDTRVLEYAFGDEGVDLASRREVLFVDQPFPNHNGGEVAFGPDGMLYVGLGDGGSENDPAGNGQKLSTLLGKLLRIDPRPDGEKPYTVPADNPFVSRPGARGEIWAFGLRNPWRFSWDRATGDLWIGDVGQDTWEEVDLLATGRPAGANLGWSLVEGPEPFLGRRAPPGAIGPIASYRTSEGCSVVGGYVYRGTRVPALTGAYLFADACTGMISALRQRDGKVTDRRAFDLRALAADAGSVRGFSVASFGQDAAGELYVLSLGGQVLRIEPVA